VTTREQLHHIIEGLGDTEASELLEYAERLLEAEETLSDEELGRARRTLGEMRRGDYVTLDEVKRKLGQ
jgi:hypothetical protein